MGWPGDTAGMSSILPMAGSVIPVALSGAQAAKLRMANSAANVANLQTTGTLPDAAGRVAEGAARAYQPGRVVQTALTGPQGQGMGTRAAVQPANPGFFAMPDPGNAAADAAGMVAAPAVDLATEAVEQITAGLAYKAALKLIKAQDEMDRELMRRQV